MSNYVIGDIQGCFQELTALLAKIHFNPKLDRLWFTGDLVNRGPQSLAVLRFVKNLINPIIVLGNHDLHLLAVVFGQAKLRKDDTLDEILAAPDCKTLCDWLRQHPLIFSDLGYTMVHAGIPPQWSLDQAKSYAREVEIVLRGKNFPELLTHLYGDTPSQWDDGLTSWPRLRLIINYLTRIRFCDANGALELNTKGTSTQPPSGFMPWFKIPSRLHLGSKIIFGHWAALEGKTDEPNIFALDTGCVWGKCLTALRLEDNARFSVPCTPSLEINV